jgi:D-serine deaminase-like pyridoxal phosphate-dependent protein
MSDIGLPKEQLDTPILWVELDSLEKNIKSLAAYFQQAGVQWRPHVKGIKVPAIAHRLLAAGAIGVTCAKLGEAEVMAQAGIRDILIANQIVGTPKITRLVHLNQYTDVKVAVDNPLNVAELGQAAMAAGVELGVLVDVNTGMNRTGVAPGEEAVELSKQVHETAGLRYLGLMAWEGHTLGHKDTAVKEQAIHHAVGLLVDSADQCRAAGLPVTIVSGGGSGTYKTTPHIKGITEIQAGGAIFSDVAYQSWGVETTPCLFIRALVTSRPAPDRIIFDTGFKAMPAWHAQPRPLGIEGIKKFSTSAEHGVMTLHAANTQIQVGDTFDFVVGYTDATLFLHDKLYGLRRDVVEVVWDIAGRGKLQ